MNILVTGACGQLGRELREIVPLSENNYFFTDLKEEQGTERLDICDAVAVQAMIERHGIGVLLNCVAYTDVEKAESDEEAAFKVNAEAPGILAEICRERSVFLIHVSTDFVFDGRSSLPYTGASLQAAVTALFSGLRGCTAVSGTILSGRYANSVRSAMP